MLTDREREQLLLKLGGRRGRSPWRLIASSINWGIVAGFAIVLGFLGWALWQAQPNLIIPATVAFVLVGWVFSLCLHEFAHAATAVFGGDDSPNTASYLTFNPLRYVNPLFSIILPLVFILIGGIGLPGGAVYLRRDLIRNRAWQSAISLAGPAANLVFAIFLTLVLRLLGPFDLFDLSAHDALQGAIAILIFFQIFAVILNLLPIPPLDGFGAIAYWLPADVRVAAWTFGNYGILVLFLLFWYVPPVNSLLFSVMQHATIALGVDPNAIAIGYGNLFFWLH